MQKLAMVALLSLSSAAINETSHVNFAAIDGVCTSVYLAQSSATL